MSGFDAAKREGAMRESQITQMVLDWIGNCGCGWDWRLHTDTCCAIQIECANFLLLPYIHRWRIFMRSAIQSTRLLKKDFCEEGSAKNSDFMGLHGGMTERKEL